MPTLSPRTLRLIAYGLLLLVGMGVYWREPSLFHEAWRLLQARDTATLRQWIHEQGTWGPLFLVLGFVVQMFMVVVPSSFLMLACVLLYGPWWGSLLSLVGMLVASTVGYGLGHLLDEATLERWIGAQTEQKLKRYVDRYGLWTVVLFRLFPFLSNDAISFVAGLLNMRYGRFMAASAIGLFPLLVALAYLGEYSDSLQQFMLSLGVGLLLGLLGYGAWHYWQSISES